MTNQTLGVHSHKFCASTVLAYVTSRIECRWVKGFVSGLVSMFLFGSLQITFLHQRLDRRGEGSKHLDFSVTNEFYRCCPQQRGPCCPFAE